MELHAAPFLLTQWLVFVGRLVAQDLKATPMQKERLLGYVLDLAPRQVGSGK